MRNIRPVFRLAPAVFLLVFLRTGAASQPWHRGLSDSGGGYWRVRVPVVSANAGEQPAAGQIVALRVGTGSGQIPLAGSAAAGLRVCNSGGTEYLFQITPDSRARLANGDILRFAADAPAKGQETYFLYADNPAALPVTDFLAAGLTNGGFEEGDGAPAGWTTALTDADHVAEWRRGEGRTGSRCVYHRVTPGAAAAWLKYAQYGIRVTPGHRYTLRAWVKARNVQGSAGWYFHVNGIRPQLVNRVLNAGEGTYDWREMRETFTIPEGGQTLDVGTVLYGSGEAWYDDVSLDEVEAVLPALSVRVGAAERLRLKAQTVNAAWHPLAPGDWRVRAEVRVLNTDAEAARGVVVTADMRRALHMLRRLAPGRSGNARAQVVDAAGNRPLPSLWTGPQLCFLADLPPQSEQRYFLYLAPEPPPGPLLRKEGDRGRSDLLAYARWVRSLANLAREGDFEDPERAKREWPTGAEGQGGPKGFQAEVAEEGIIGKRCLKLTVPPAAPLAWSGWRQSGIRVKPNTAYLYAGYVKTDGVADGSVALHAHMMAADGSLCRNGAFYSTGDSLSGTTPWTLCAGMLTTPADCASVELHLTMNAHGTVRHDGILFMEAAEGTVTAVQGRSALSGSPRIAVWSVNPMVKLFPDDPPMTSRTYGTAWVKPALSRLDSCDVPMSGAAVVLSAARNEREPFQLGLWSRTPLRNVRVEVSPLRNASGRTLPPVQRFLVATVPVDRPSAYYSSRLPDWCRRVPTGAGATDGWAGEWPDPLPPLKPFDLPAQRAQALWFNVYVPPDAPPDDYRGEVTLRAEGAAPLRVPVRLHVWNFALPKESRLHVVYDLRSGPGWDVTKGDDPATLRKWYRLLAEHRVNPDTIHPEPAFRYENGKVEMDAARFDEMAAYCFDTLKMNHAYTPWLLYACGWAYRPHEIFGFKPFTPEYEAAFKAAYKTYVDHVTARGWRDKIVDYLSDEPHFDNSQVVSDLRYVIGLAKSVAPDIPIYSSTWRHCPGLDGWLTNWGIGQYGCFPVEKMQERRKAGDRLTFTTDGQQALDTPYLGTERLLPAYCFKYGVAGYEFWGVSWWTSDPWKRGWHQYIRQSDQGTDFYYIRYPNGDGYLTYPGEPVGVDGPVSSLRLEAVREGAEDYEYYTRLNDLVAGAQARGVDTASAIRALDAVRALVTIPNAGGLRSTQIMPDPDAVYRVRRQVAEQIERLSLHISRKDAKAQRKSAE
jgi:hypothetical protein